MRALLLAWAIFFGVLAAAQEKATVGDFTKSPTEHIINHMEQVFVVRSVKGVVMRGTRGSADPLRNVVFEIQGPGKNRKIRRTTTDENGRFRIGRVPVGNYKFKATLNGSQSVMGNISVSKDAPKTSEIKITMAVGV